MLMAFLSSFTRWQNVCSCFLVVMILNFFEVLFLLSCLICLAWPYTVFSLLKYCLSSSLLSWKSVWWCYAHHYRIWTSSQNSQFYRDMVFVLVVAETRLMIWPQLLEGSYCDEVFWFHSFSCASAMFRQFGNDGSIHEGCSHDAIEWHDVPLYGIF